jgi:hypothetical protein
MSFFLRQLLTISLSLAVVEAVVMVGEAVAGVDT